MPSPKRYVHYFNVLVSNSFSSDIEDFDEAVNEWIRSFISSAELRAELLHCDECAFALAKDIQHEDTVDREGHPCTDCIAVHGINESAWMAQWPAGAEWRHRFQEHLCDGCFDERINCDRAAADD
jgi:hypothetical protein